MILTISQFMKAPDQFIPVALFVVMYKVLLAFDVDEILNCDHSNES